MKKDVTTRIFDKCFDYKEDHSNANKWLKAVIINFGDERGDIVVENDNFGKRRKYACFTEGKKKAGLNPFQIVFMGLDFVEKGKDKYINAQGKVCYF